MDNKLHETDTGTLTGAQRRALAELIRGPYISHLNKPEVFQTVSASREVLGEQLDNLFLTLIVDDNAGVAYVKAWDENVAEQRALLRTMSLTFMDTVVILHLRRELVTTNPNERTIVDETEVFEATLPYQAAGGTDHSSRRKKFDAAWNKMKNNSIVIKTPTEGRFEVSPVLRIIFSAEEIATVTKSFETLLEEHT
ncbi:DUF4194 domain-containing protein [Corynebacterium hindlerae]|uniref:DUF4194 domain-containing protein n=1 Tax=Corynebacterium hindlerae TaxID=699041 RepID=A0A7G5FCI8_9CORY|nr:DUF4194 domain-containing protein [Corynebacterium hindlerae]QMV84329.1 DUF4194 domain-containing protein [Corynebacterium hindlerae]